MIMSPVRLLARAALSTPLRSVLLFAFAALALFAEHRSAAAGDDILHALEPVTDAMLAKPAPEDWLMRLQLSRLGL
jgi:hypothetical protein